LGGKATSISLFSMVVHFLGRWTPGMLATRLGVGACIEPLTPIRYNTGSGPCGRLLERQLRPSACEDRIMNADGVARTPVPIPKPDGRLGTDRGPEARQEPKSG
jgi:hypothetical protein